VNSTQKIKTAAATLMAGFLLSSALAGLAHAGNGKPQALTTEQRQAVLARAEAWNRYYHLGKYSPQAEALRGEMRRAEATDRYYHLGKYAVVSASSPFDWADAGIGAGAMLGAILLVGGLTVALLRRRVVRKPSFPTAS